MREMGGRLVFVYNSRNRPTHALVQALLVSQARYLLSGEPMSLVPPTQAQMAERLRIDAGLSMVADAGRISRLVRGLSILLPNGKALPLPGLFPRARQLHCHYVDYLIKRENRGSRKGYWKSLCLMERLPKSWRSITASDYCVGRWPTSGTSWRFRIAGGAATG
ncbi:MAG: hypothetical protein ACOZB1_13175 [Pseudomonadota bacterium]